MQVGILKHAWLFFGLALLSDAKEERNWLNSSFEHMQQVESVREFSFIVIDDARSHIGALTVF